MKCKKSEKPYSFNNYHIFKKYFMNIKKIVKTRNFSPNKKISNIMRG